MQDLFKQVLRVQDRTIPTVKEHLKSMACRWPRKMQWSVSTRLHFSWSTSTALFMIKTAFFTTYRSKITKCIWRQSWDHNSKMKEEKIYLPPGFEPWSPGTESQCSTYELCWPPLALKKFRRSWGALISKNLFLVWLKIVTCPVSCKSTNTKTVSF